MPGGQKAECSYSLLCCGLEKDGAAEDRASGQLQTQMSCDHVKELWDPDPPSEQGTSFDDL